MRFLTKGECREINERWHRLRGDLRQMNAKNAGMAIELTTARQWIDRWRRRALAAEQAQRDTADAMRAAHQKLIAENARLRDELAAAVREEACD